MNVKIASAQYDISFLKDWNEYQQKSEHWVKQATHEGAKILLFPEYNTMELASLFERHIYSSLSLQLESLQTLHDEFITLWKKLAWTYSCYIQAGTFPVKIASGAYRNRAYLFMPSGEYDHQEKMVMTRFENEQWLIESGDQLRCFQTEYGKIAINICYDSEFPLLARQQVEAGADLILVPSCTDTVAGFHRVQIGCRARALENQCYVVQSALVGNAPWSEAVDVNVGAAAIYTPIDYGFPNNGIQVMGEFNQVQWVFGEISLTEIAKVRAQGQVFNYRDWEKQHQFNGVK